METVTSEKHSQQKLELAKNCPKHLTFRVYKDNESNNFVEFLDSENAVSELFNYPTGVLHVTGLWRPQPDQERMLEVIWNCSEYPTSSKLELKQIVDGQILKQIIEAWPE